jgi:hypothetical protein
MLVYCSEYYYHINEQAKRDLAAKRIAKLIRFTQENDAARAKYQSNGETLLKHIATAEALLQDVQTITNTMAGTQADPDPPPFKGGGGQGEIGSFSASC